MLRRDSGRKTRRGVVHERFEENKVLSADGR